MDSLTWDNKARGYSITFDQMKAYAKQFKKSFESAITMAYGEAYEDGYREAVSLHRNWNDYRYQKAMKEIESMKCCSNCDRKPSPFHGCMMDCSRQECTDSTSDLWELKEQS